MKQNRTLIFFNLLFLDFFFDLANFILGFLSLRALLDCENPLQNYSEMIILLKLSHPKQKSWTEVQNHSASDPPVLAANYWSWFIIYYSVFAFTSRMKRRDPHFMNSYFSSTEWLANVIFLLINGNSYLCELKRPKILWWSSMDEISLRTLLPSFRLRRSLTSTLATAPGWQLPLIRQVESWGEGYI